MARLDPLLNTLASVEERLVTRLTEDVVRSDPSKDEHIRDKLYRLQAMTWAIRELRRELQEN